MALREAWIGMHETAGETVVTHRLWEFLNKEFAAATQDQRLARAFEADVFHLAPWLASQGWTLHQLSHSLFMNCQLHDVAKETISGGDFGLVISRPKVEGAGNVLRFPGSENGLLCQAKWRSRKSSLWGKLTPNQVNVLAERTDLTSLVLFEAEASGALAPIMWQPLAGFDIADAQKWLKTKTFPGRLGSAELLEQLKSGKIGSSDQFKIDEVIRVNSAPRLDIRIDWPDGQGPPTSGIWIRERQVVRQFA